MIRATIWGAIGLLLAVGVHLASILAIPEIATRSAYARLAGVPDDGEFHLMRQSANVLPRQDPATVMSVCRYSLKDGPIHISSPTSNGFLSVSLYTPDGLSYYALHDRSFPVGSIEMTLYTTPQLAEARSQDGPDTPENLRIEAPGREGLVLIRGLAREATEIPAIEAIEAKASCRPAR